MKRDSHYSDLRQNAKRRGWTDEFAAEYGFLAGLAIAFLANAYAIRDSATQSERRRRFSWHCCKKILKLLREPSAALGQGLCQVANICNKSKAGTHELDCQPRQCGEIRARRYGPGNADKEGSAHGNALDLRFARAGLGNAIGRHNHQDFSAIDFAVFVARQSHFQLTILCHETIGADCHDLMPWLAMQGGIFFQAA
jgi:hypothetical protein